MAARRMHGLLAAMQTLQAFTEVVVTGAWRRGISKQVYFCLRIQQAGAALRQASYLG